MATCRCSLTFSVQLLLVSEEAFWVVEGLSEMSETGLFHSTVSLFFTLGLLAVLCNTCVFSQFIKLSDVLGLEMLLVVLLIVLIVDLSLNVLLEV